MGIFNWRSGRRSDASADGEVDMPENIAESSTSLNKHLVYDGVPNNKMDSAKSSIIDLSASLLTNEKTHVVSPGRRDRNEQVNPEPDSTGFPIFHDDHLSTVDHYQLLDDEQYIDDPLQSYFFDKIDGLYDISADEKREGLSIYGQMWKIYADKSSETIESKTRSKPLLCCMLIVLISNPIIGIYTLYNFTTWEPWDTPNGSLTAYLSPIKGNIKGDNGTNDYISNNTALPTYNSVTVEQMEPIAIALSHKIKQYAFYEVFGEIIFALCSLVLLCTSRFCCKNGMQRTQSMLPCIGLLYTVIYKILAMYVLLVGIKLLYLYIYISVPTLQNIVPYAITRLFNTAGLDLTNETHFTVLGKLYELDAHAHKWLIIYCLENVYITIADSMEFIATLYKILKRNIKRAISKRQEGINGVLDIGDQMHPETQSDPFYNSYLFLDTLFNKTGAVQENYIAGMYKYVNDLGTYLDNVDIKQYTKGIHNFGAKLEKHKSPSESNYRT